QVGVGGRVGSGPRAVRGGVVHRQVERLGPVRLGGEEVAGRVGEHVGEVPGCIDRAVLVVQRGAVVGTTAGAVREPAHEVRAADVVGAQVPLADQAEAVARLAEVVKIGALAGEEVRGSGTHTR